jgi:hypothetical protein
MPMNPYTKIDFHSRISALRTVGTALTAGNTNIPASTASADKMACLYWINKLRVQQGLTALPKLDYTGFQAALNILVARVP